MKIKLKDLLPNPFKKQINGGKLNQEKIEKLKESIKSDGFWDNVICRKTEDGYEMAYGHHRVEAAKKILGNDHIVDIPCKNLSDEMMVRILANENNMQNEELAIYQVDTVKMAKLFLESSASNVRTQTKPHTRTDQGIGSRQISEFLGEKNWCKTKVAEYLAIGSKLDEDILEEVKNKPNTGGEKIREFTVSHAREIARLPKEKQKKVFAIVRDQELDSRGTQEVVNNILGTERKVEHRRKVNMDKVDKVLINLEGRELLLRFGDLITLLGKHSLDEFDIKEKIILKDWVGQLKEALTKFVGGKYA